jgi:hypothetical protein
MPVKYPHLGYFAKRVWICLIAKELTFLATNKSPQQYVRTGVRALFTTEFAENPEFRGSAKNTIGQTQMIIKTKELRKKQFVTM